MQRWRRRPAIYGVGLAAAAAGGVHWLVHGDHVDDRTGLVLTAAVLLGLVLALPAAVRAATRSVTGQAPARRRYAAVLAPPALLFITALFVRASFVDASVAMAALIGGTETVPTALALGPGGLDVRLSGDLTEGAASRLAALLDAHPRVGRIHLTSEGGLAEEGQALGEVIAAHRLATFVPDYCVSACTLAFARGRERLMMDDARLGYHAPYEQGLFGAQYRDDSSGQRAAYLAAGLPAGFVDRALAVDPSDMWFPTRAELLAAGAVTRIVDHDTLPDSTLDGAATPGGARAMVLRNFPLLQALAARRPAALERIAGWYLDGYRRGGSEGENAHGLRLLVRGVVASALAHADEGVLRDLGPLLLRGVAASTDAGRCGRIAGEGDLTEAAAALREDGADAEAAELLDRALKRESAAAPAPQPAAVVLAATVPSCAASRRDLAALLARPQGGGALRARLGASVARALRSLPRALPPAPPSDPPPG